MVFCHRSMYTENCRLPEASVFITLGWWLQDLWSISPALSRPHRNRAKRVSLWKISAAPKSLFWCAV